MHKRIISVMLSALIFTTFLSVNVQADPTSDISSQQQKISDQNNLLNNAKSKTQSYEVQAEVLDGQINKKNAEISATTGKINTVKLDIGKTQKDLQEAEKEVKAEQDIYNKRMRAIYETGGSGYLTVILTSRDFSDMISKVEVVSKISEMDKKVMKELDAKKAVVKTKQEALNKQNTELNTYLADQKSKLNDLNTKKTQYNVILSQAKKDEAQYASQVEAEKKKLKQLRAQVAAQQAEARKKLSRGGTVTPASASSNAIVAYASGFLGTPYLWGGTTPAGFDCSGFMQYVYAHFGISIGRTTYAQVYNGSPVALGDLQPGDLIFFGTSTSNVHHVGMYIGGGMFIHAPHTNDVIKISSLSYMSDYYCARRILK